MTTAATPEQLFSLQDRVVVVTGASSGLGQRFARVAHVAGATVVASARRQDRLDALAEELPGVIAIGADVTEPASVERLVTSALENCGRIDVLVNNAGGGDPAAALDETVDAFTRTLELNLVSVFRLSQMVGRHMVKRRTGSIINVASIFGLVGAWPAKYAGYAASKGGIVQMTRELACQWASDGVRVNAIAPGFFPSELTDRASGDDAFQRYVRTGCPMRRMGEEHELDGALLFLASNASSFVTGQTLTVDGGWTAH